MDVRKGVMKVREKNLALAARGYELFSKADLDGLRREIFTEDAIWRTAGYGRFDLEYKGVDAVMGYFTELAELTGGTFKAEPLHILADDERAVVIQRVTGTREDRLLDTLMLLVFEIRDDKVYEVTQYVPEAKTHEVFWA